MSLCRITKVSESTFLELSERGPTLDPTVIETVAETLQDIKARGLEAALEYARRFDAPDLTLDRLVVGEGELQEAELPDAFASAIKTSIERVWHFHESQLKALSVGLTNHKWTIKARKNQPDSGYEGQRLIPISRAGIYVPGGQANYPSSVIMNGIPAVVAGVSEVVMVSPARRDGSLSPAVLFTAREVGIKTIVKVGGAAAIGLLAFGDSPSGFARVDKIAGPGNRYVNEAKRQLWGTVGLDSYAGPSEVAVIVDESANAEWAAADWLTQVEHAEDNAGFLIAWSEQVANKILAAAERQLQSAPRAGVMRKALEQQGRVFLCADIDEAVEISNAIAPEHLSVMIENAESLVPRLNNAGCILIGDFTPQSAGDFCSGPSHTLPTSNAARFGSPVNVMDFLKFQSISNLTQADLAELRPTIEAFGEMEGFPTHGHGASVRFK